MAERRDEPSKRGAPCHGEEPKIRRSIAIDRQVWESAMETASRREESVSGVVEDSLRLYVKKNAGK